MPVTRRVHVGVRVDPDFFGFIERRHNLREVESAPDDLHDLTHLLLVVSPLCRTVRLSDLLTDGLDVDALNENPLHELLPLLQLLAELSSPLLVLLLPQVMRLVGLQYL